MPNVNMLITPIRLRIMADISFTGLLDPCRDSIYGQAEDYTVYLVENTQPPSNSFECDKNYSFTSSSSPNPTLYADFLFSYF